MKKYIKNTFFIMVVFILLLFVPPLIEGFSDCIMLKIDVSEIKDALKTPTQTSQVAPEHAELAVKSQEQYSQLNDKMSLALNTN